MRKVSLFARTETKVSVNGREIVVKNATPIEVDADKLAESLVVIRNQLSTKDGAVQAGMPRKLVLDLNPMIAGDPTLEGLNCEALQGAGFPVHQETVEEAVKRLAKSRAINARVNASRNKDGGHGGPSNGGIADSQQQ